MLYPFGAMGGAAVAANTPVPIANAWLRLLRQHPICCVEVFSGMRDERCVTRMIDGFDPDDDRHPLRIVLVDVLDKLGLGISRPGYENRARVCNRIHDGVKIVVVFRGMPAPDGVGLVMDMSGRMIRMQDEPFDIRRAEMEDAGLVMIDPDDGVLVMLAHETSPFSIWPRGTLARERNDAREGSR
jgi:hypothetical protein